MPANLSNETFIQRARISFWGVPLIGLVAVALQTVLLERGLPFLISDSVVIDGTGQLWTICLTLFLPPFVVVYGGWWVLETWRRRYAPTCPACKTQLIVCPGTAVRTGRCYNCGEPLSENAKPSDVPAGMERAEFVRRCQLFQRRFVRNLLFAFGAAAGILYGGIGLGALLLPEGRDLIPLYGGGWTAVGAFVALYGGIILGGLEARRHASSLGLDCPQCRKSLLKGMHAVVTTGHCPACNAGVVKL